MPRSRKIVVPTNAESDPVVLIECGRHWVVHRNQLCNAGMTISMGAQATKTNLGRQMLDTFRVLESQPSGPPRPAVRYCSRSSRGLHWQVSSGGRGWKNTNQSSYARALDAMADGAKGGHTR